MAELTKNDQKRLENASEILGLYLDELKKLDKEKSSQAFQRSCKAFEVTMKGIAPLPFNPQFNAVYWAYELINLGRKLVIGYCWMEAYAKQYKKTNPPGKRPSDSSVYVSLFADFCATGIDSFRDKLALMVWAFYCPFNPENKVLSYKEVVDRLRKPSKFGIKLKNQKPFMNYLAKLKGNHFKLVENQRHLWIHRLSPRIEIYNAGPHHSDFYMLPLTNSKEIAEWEKALLKKCHNDADMASRIKKGCYVDGTLFNRKPLMCRVFEYNEVKKNIRKSLLECLSAFASCLNLLRRRVL